MKRIDMNVIAEAKAALNLWGGNPFMRTVGRMMKSALNGDMTPRVQTYWAVLRAAGGIRATSNSYSVDLPTTDDVLTVLLREDTVRPILTYTDEKGYTKSYDLSRTGWRHEAVENTSFMSTLFTWGEEVNE